MEPDRTEPAEAVVVGCGPGGAVLSYLLARSGVEVALVERAATFEREFRGLGYSPGVVDLFDEMGVLDRVLALDHETVRRGEFVLYGREVEMLDFDVLDTAHPYGLMMEQPALLELLVDAAGAYDGFSFHPETTVTDLLTEGNAVVGVRATDRDAGETVEFRGPLVVGADGRFSTVRSAAGIDPGLFDSSLELVWFKLPSDAVGATAQGRIERAGMLAYFGLGNGELQVGWFVPKGSFPDLRRAGIAAFRDRLAAVDPRLRPALEAHLTGFDRCSLLSIAPGVADEWVRDGLLLLGDAAHVASPLGAQGNALAIGDAVAAHAVVTAAIDGDRERGPIPASTLAGFESRRRPAVEEIITLQRRSERSLELFVKYGHRFPPAVVGPLARGMARLLPKSRLARRGIERFALGPDRVAVDTSRFVD